VNIELVRSRSLVVVTYDTVLRTCLDAMGMGNKTVRSGLSSPTDHHLSINHLNYFRINSDLQSSLLNSQDPKHYGRYTFGPSCITYRHLSILHRNFINDTGSHYAGQPSRQRHLGSGYRNSGRPGFRSNQNQTVQASPRQPLVHQVDLVVSQKHARRCDLSYELPSSTLSGDIHMATRNT
jgi:hypothetical protein